MPLYTFECVLCKHRDTELYPMSQAVTVGDQITCPKCGKCSYRRQIDLPHTDLKDFWKPIEMHSVAATSEEELRELKGRCPDVEISTNPNSELYGVPIVKNRAEKRKVLQAVGFHEV
jgi:putative FmdB family regulatory protein